MIFRALYSMWAIFSIAIFFFIFIIPLILCAPFKKLHWQALHINRLWAWAFFRLALLPVKQEWHFKPDHQKQYILCANHFSYLDIPALSLFPLPFKFVGKSQLGKIPLFGYMYNKIHVTVNRNSYKSRAQSLLKARNELSDGFSLGFFPEGGIRSSNFPKMVDFKDGAFRLAVEHQTPIVPVTFLNNYRILKDDKLLSMRRGTCHIIYHPPIMPTVKGEVGIKKLRSQVFDVIQSELDKRNS